METNGRERTNGEGGSDVRYEIRAMSLGEVLDTGFQLLRNNFVVLIGIGLTAAIPSAVFPFLMTFGGPDPATLGIVTGLTALVVSLLITPVVTAAITHALGEAYLGRPIRYGDSMRVGFKLYLPLVGTSILSGILVMIGMLLLIIPGIYLALAFAFIYQIVTLERVAGTEALKRSRALATENMGRIFAIYLCCAVLYMAAGFAVQFGSMGITAALLVGNSLVAAIYTVYQSAATVVLYFDIRCRKEAFDLEYLANVVDAEAGEPAPAV